MLKQCWQMPMDKTFSFIAFSTRMLPDTQGTTRNQSRYMNRLLEENFPQDLLCYGMTEGNKKIFFAAAAHL